MPAVTAITTPPTGLKGVKALAAGSTQDPPDLNWVGFGVVSGDAVSSLCPGLSSGNCLFLEPTTRLRLALWAVATEPNEGVGENAAAAVAIRSEVDAAVYAPGSAAEADRQRTTVSHLELQRLGGPDSRLLDRQPSLLKSFPDVTAVDSRKDGPLTNPFERLVNPVEDVLRCGLDDIIGPSLRSARREERA